jgi:hypothetical protein
MPFFASTDRTTGEVGQAELAEKRRLDEHLKQIGYQQQSVMTALSIWLRCRDANPKQAAQALQRLVNARQEENRLFRELLGIEQDQLAISKG